MKVLVTGNSGLIGKALVQYLLTKPYHIVGVDLVDCEVEIMRPHKQHICDINDFEQFNKLLLKENPDYIIHLAARTDLDGLRLSDYKTNTTAVENLVNQTYILTNLKRIIYTSSMLVCYAGYNPKTDLDYKPTTIYGESKVVGEKFIRSANSEKCSWIIVRPTTVWGPYMNEHYSRFLKMLKKGYYFHTGTEKLYKSYSFVENIAFQYLQLLIADEKNAHGKTFYLADYKPLSLRDYTTALSIQIRGKKPIAFPYWFSYLLARTGDFIKLLGVPFPFNSFRLKNILTEYQFDLSELELLTGTLPVDFELGVTKTAEWFKKTQGDS